MEYDKEHSHTLAQVYPHNLCKTHGQVVGPSKSISLSIYSTHTYGTIARARVQSLTHIRASFRFCEHLCTAAAFYRAVYASMHVFRSFFIVCTSCCECVCSGVYVIRQPGATAVSPSPFRIADGADAAKKFRRNPKQNRPADRDRWTIVVYSGNAALKRPVKKSVWLRSARLVDTQQSATALHYRVRAPRVNCAIRPITAQNGRTMMQSLRLR